MRLGVRMLNNSSTLNNLMYVNQTRINPGETATIMFQLVDLDQQDVYQQKAPIRYIPLVGSQVTAALNSINQANNLSKIPSNPFTDDRSIWSFNLLASETQTMAGVNMSVNLVEGSAVRVATAEAAVIVGPSSKYSC
jgi:hypothetical protein